MYAIVRFILFQFNTEAVHYFSMNSLRFFCKFGWLRSFISKQFTPTQKGISKTLFGLTFGNPVGLGAGFDKNASYLLELQTLGFGFVEIGTVTPLPQEGNSKPRLFRLPKDKALINRMGFNNDGVAIIAKRLQAYKATTKHRIIIGGNIGKNKITPNEDAWKDYLICFKELHDVVDYFVVNVSSPNTPGLRELQEKDALTKIFKELQAYNFTKATPKPLLLKIAPDLTNEQLDEIVALALEMKLDGLVATNTTIDRNNLITDKEILTQIGAGGLSGKPVEKRNTEVVTYLAKKLNGQIPIIASGGIFNGKDAAEKLKAGASLVQVWTGFVYEGPSIVNNICSYLAGR